MFPLDRLSADLPRNWRQVAFAVGYPFLTLLAWAGVITAFQIGSFSGFGRSPTPCRDEVVPFAFRLAGALPSAPPMVTLGWTVTGRVWLSLGPVLCPLMLMVPLAFLRVLDCRGIISLDLRNLPWNVVLMTLFLIPLTVILVTGLRGLRATR